MAKKHPNPKFTGPLAEPIYPPKSFGLLETSEDQSLKQHVRVSWREKMKLLLDYYQIDRADPDCWLGLSCGLALDFVPGMRVAPMRPPGRGRKRTWQAGLGAELIRAVDRTMRERSLGIEAAITDLRKANPKWRRYTAQNLAARLREAKRHSRLVRKQMAELLSNTGRLSLARPGIEQMGALFGIEESATNPPVVKTDGNSAA